MDFANRALLVSGDRCPHGSSVPAVSEADVKRRLTVILAADVVGYGRLMQQDEQGTLAALKARRRDFLNPLVTRHQGRVFKTVGDGVLIEFSSAVAALNCGVALQEAFAAANADVAADRQIVLRIGINLGEVMVEGGDLYGDGVNIAARLETLAEPGGVCISQVVYDNVRGRVPFVLEDRGPQTLKNIDGPIGVFVVTAGTLGGRTVFETAKAGPVDPGKPSIAVLPFNNMSGDPEQEYFSDGITEDIITDLSKVSGLSVVGRNTVFTYKGKPMNLQQTAAELGVAFLLEGSVRKSGKRVRITAQLINGNDGLHLWADRYDRDLHDIFDLQDEITKTIVGQLKVKLLPEEKKAIATPPTGNLEAYELVLMARHYDYTGTISDTKATLRLAERAAAMDPGFAEAWALVAISQSVLHEMLALEDNGLTAAERALALSPKLAAAHAAKGRALAGMARYDEAIAFHTEALRLNPDSFDAHYLYGRTCTMLGQAEPAIRHLERASALLDSDYHALALTQQNYRQMGRHKEAIDAGRRAMERIEKALARRPDDTTALILGAANLAGLGETERAASWANRAMLLEPDDPHGLYNLACAFALIGELDRSVEFLERLASMQIPNFVVWAKNDEDLKNLRVHPRYKALIARLEERFAAQQKESVAETG